jgi:hypothetical protein
MGDVTIKGMILRETPSGMAWVFMPDDRLTAGRRSFSLKALWRSLRAWA